MISTAMKVEAYASTIVVAKSYQKCENENHFTTCDWGGDKDPVDGVRVAMV
jgi:hypothetical protein